MIPGIFGQVARSQHYKKTGSDMAKSLIHEEWYESNWFTNPCLLGVIQKNKKPFSLYRIENISGAMMGYLTNKDLMNQRSRPSAEKNGFSDIIFVTKLYEKLGTNFVKKLKGLFNIALFDEIKNQLLLANDKFGYFPIFYLSKENFFIFAPEAKAILAGAKIVPEIEECSIPEFLTFKFPLGDRTFFKGIRRLRPGSILIYDFDKNVMLMEQYDFHSSQYAAGQEKPSNSTNVLRLFKKLMKQAVQRSIKGRNKIGLFLSGGLDSAILAAFASETKSEVVTFTFGHKGPNISRDSAKSIAELFGLENHYYELPSDFLFNYAEDIVYRGDGLVRIRESHFISCLEDIRKKTDAVLMGTLGEIFRDISLFNFALSYWGARIRGLSQEDIFLQSKSYALPLNKYPLVFNEDFARWAQGAVVSDFHADFLRVMGLKDHKAWDLTKPAREDFRLRWGLQIGFPRWLAQQFQFVEWYLDTFHPFLDYDVFNFALSLPMWIKQGNTFINRAMAYCFPQLAKIRLENGACFHSNPISLIFENLKMKIESGSYPFFPNRLRKPKNAKKYEDYRDYANWLRTGSKNLVDNILDQPIFLTKYFRKEFIEKTIKNHMTLIEDNNQIICDLINLELLHRIMLPEE